MQLQGRNLSVQMEGEDVKLLQRELRLLGFDILEDEVARTFFGRTTLEAVKTFQQRHNLELDGIVGERTAALINQELEGQEPPPPQAFVVKGRVIHVDGRPIANSVVRAFDMRLRTADLLGETTTDPQGNYEIQYSAEQFQRDGKDTVNLRISASSAAAGELAISPILYNAGPEETIDLLFGGDVYRGPSDNDTLVQDLTPRLEGLSFTDLREDETYQDVTFLSRESGQDPQRIALLVQAHRLMQKTEVPAEVFYGLFREGLPTQLPELLAQSPDVQRRALVRAAEDNIIPAHLAQEADQILEQFKGLSVTQAFEPPAEEGKSSLVGLLSTTLPDVAQQQTFLTAYVNHQGPIEEFWAGLQARPELADQVENVQFTLQLGALTKSHLPLVRELQRRREAGEIATLSDLVRFNEEDWLQIITSTTAGAPIGFPPDVPGQDDEEKARNYARAMAHMVEDAFPTTFVTRRIEQDDLPGKEDLLTFFNTNPEFDLKATRLDSYLRDHPDALGNVVDVEGTKHRIKVMQRLYRLAPRYAQMNVLLKNDLHSAHHIARISQNIFLAMFGGAFGGAAQAKKVHDRARQVQATAVNLLAEYGPMIGRISMQAVPDKPVSEVEGIPEWSTLFGSLELCDCEHCLSVYGPASYLVDILHFLKDRPAKNPGFLIGGDTDQPSILTAPSAKDALFACRPDLGEVELTCENTNTPLPYVDLVNEALEGAVAPFPAFMAFDLLAAQPAGADFEAQLNGRTLSEALRAAFTPPLSPHAVVTVGGQGQPWTVGEPWWAIDDVAFTYTIRKADGQLRVVSRGRQTKGLAAERAANPQYVNPEAYEVLRQQVYPWSLPFDLWWEEARVYLGHLGIPRDLIMETFLPGEDLETLNDPTMAREYLRLTATEANIITGVTLSQPGADSPGLWNLWGFETAELSAQHSIPDPADSTRNIASGHWLDVLRGRVDVFLQQSGLPYKDMLELLDTYFINPMREGARAIQIVSTDPANPATCETDKLSLQGLDEATAVNVVRFVRLARTLGWTMRDLDRAITAFNPADLNDAFITQLSHVQRLHSALNLQVVRLLGWWASLDTALYIDYDAPGQPQIPSLYAQLFRNRTVTNPLDQDFPDDADDLNPVTPLSAQSATITAALGISAADLALLLGDANVIPRSPTDPTQPDDTLSLDYLSRLYRHATLAKALKLPVRDYLTALRLISANPFAATADTVRFVEKVGQVRDSGFTMAELDYLLRHAFTPSSGIAPSEEAIAVVLDEIRSGLQKIVAENAFSEDPGDPGGVTADPNGDLTRQKLALLNWDGALIERVAAMLNGAVIYEAPLDLLPPGLMLPNDLGTYEVDLAALPAGFAFPPQLGNAITYDAAHLKLKGSRLLTQPERVLLRDAAVASGDGNFIAAVDALFKLQDELQGGITYDPDTHKLRFTGAMTEIRRTRLKNASPDALYQSAIDVLFNAPRQFIARHMRTFSIHDFATELAGLPEGLQIPKALRGKVYFDTAAEPTQVHFIGVMTEPERETLLGLSTDAAYQAAVHALFAQPDALVPAADDAFLTASGPDNDAAGMFDSPTAPEARFVRVLRKLLPYLRRWLSERLVEQKIAEAFRLEAGTAEALLTRWVTSPADPEPNPALKRRALAEFLDPAFAESSPNVKPTRKAFPMPFKTFTRLHKISTIVTKFKVTSIQLAWLFEYGPPVGWLDLNTLPTDPQDPAASFDRWLRLVDLFGLRDGLPMGELALAEVFSLARTVGVSPAELVMRLSEHTLWDLRDLEFLVGAQGFNFAMPDAFQDERALVRLRACFAVLKRLGIAARLCRELAEGDVTLEEARAVLQAVRAKYDEAQWLNLAKPLRDVLREQQRAALVAHLVAHLRLPLPMLAWPSHPELAEGVNSNPVVHEAIRELQQKLNAAGVSPALKVDGIFGPETRDAVVMFQQTQGLPANGIVNLQTWMALEAMRRRVRDANDLYAHFLIDVEMAPCMMTSRIKQAISSIQLFVQRCLMNLEPEVTASAGLDEQWREWKWMKQYRVWEANRKVFLYPENWIEPELRDDKSPFFKELESELLQSDLTLETAEAAFLSYLEKLDQVARLEIVGMYHQVEEAGDGNVAVDILHVFGRTYGTPHVYYYRQRVDSAYWTAWERVDLDIEGDHLIPVVWNRRLYLFWLVFMEKREEQEMKMPAVGETVKPGARYWDIQLAWSEYQNRKWTPKKLSKEMTRANWLDLFPWFEPREVITCKGFIAGDELVVRLYSYTLARYQWPFAEFRFSGCNSTPTVRKLSFGVGPDAPVVHPDGTLMRGMLLVESSEVLDQTGNKLVLFTGKFPTTGQGEPAFNNAKKNIPTLNRTPGTFRLLAPHQDAQFASQRAFFFQDDTRTFFVVPSEVRVRVWDWQGGTTIDPGRVLDLPNHYYEELKPLPIGPIGPVINPADPMLFEPSFPVRPELGLATTTGITGVARVVSPAGMGQAMLAGFSGRVPHNGGSSSGEPPLRIMDQLANLTSPAPGGMMSVLGGYRASVASRILTAGMAGDTAGLLTAKPASTVTVAKFLTVTRYLFQTFYHPYVCAFVYELNRNGIDGLLQRKVQTEPRCFLPRPPSGPPPEPLDFEKTYEPEKGTLPTVIEPYPQEIVDFESDGSYSLYNWELFFHAPLMIADRLSKNQRFEEAQKWFQYIFDPTDTSDNPVPQRYWRTKKFYETTREDYQKARIQHILTLLAKGGDPAQRAQLSPEEVKELERFENSVREWRKYPFKPHLIARMRTTAYQKVVVMKYIDNLIAWGDQLFRRDTIESINEATQLYILAAEILGRRPEDVPPRATPRVQTYNSLEATLDAFSNALVQIEEFVPPSAANGTMYPGEQPPLNLPGMLYFCVPKNDKLLGYWDTVADRLFKIRHCMNIEGVVRQLPLFEPPIDPGLLVRAAAAGIDISSVLNDINAALPHYRFNVMVQKASELCTELKSLGSALLTALEKRDAEELALIRTRHETTLLNMIEQVKEQQYDEAEQNLAALRKSRDVAVTRYLHYQGLLGAQSLQVPAEGQPIPEQAPAPHMAIQEEDGIKMISYEQDEMDQLKKANEEQNIASWFEFAANIGYYVPTFAAYPFGVGVEYGGQHIGPALSAVASRFRADSADHTYQGGRAARLGQYALRAHDWTLQSNLAAREIMQIDKQIAAAEIRKEIAQRELENHRKQLDQAREVEEFMQDKYTNQELYAWMVGQVAGVYFQTYQLTYDVAKRTERAYRHELGLKDSNFVQFGYWDNLKRGLLAGEKLYHDLKRMEVAYLDQNKREYEITKHISLVQLDPLALIQLKQTGGCFVSLPEAFFDLDYPGHYMRRIKSASVTIPCVTGPYTSVNCTLTLLKSSVRHGNTLPGGKYARQDEDPRFTDSSGAIQSIVTSSGQNDSGLFETNMRDERYLPFEGAGTISEWHLELPRDFRQFDYDTISDVVLHLSYTAREGGGSLKHQATAELQTALNEVIRSENQQGLARLFSLRHEFSIAWHRFLNPPPDSAGDQTLTMALTKDRFPFLFQNKSITMNTNELFVKIKPEFADTHNESTLKLSLEPGTAASGNPVALALWGGLLRAEKVTNSPPADWTLTAWLDTGGGAHERLDPHAIQDIMVVCRYQVM